MLLFTTDHFLRNLVPRRQPVLDRRRPEHWRLLLLPRGARLGIALGPGPWALVGRGAGARAGGLAVAVWKHELDI